MTRRILAIVLVIITCFTMTACGGKSEQDNTLRVAMECAYAPYNWAQSDDSNGAVPMSGTGD